MLLWAYKFVGDRMLRFSFIAVFDLYESFQMCSSEI